MMTTLDWIYLSLLGLSGVLGLWRGFMWEVMSLAGWFVAGTASIYGADFLSPHLAMTGLSDTLRYGLAFVLIFIASLILWSMLTSAIKSGVGAMGVGLLDRLFGAGFGLFRGALILTLFTILLTYTPIHSADFWQQSTAVAWCQQAAQSLKHYLPPAAGAFIP